MRRDFADAGALLHRNVNAVELAAAAEHFLSGVDVHHRQIAAESAGQSAGFHDAANGEAFLAFHGLHGNRRADREMIFLCERGGDDQRIGLGQKDQRIVDAGLVAAFDVVIAQAAVARHIDAQDQNVALPRKPRAGDSFNHRNRRTDLRNRLHALQNVFVESRFSGRDLQLRRARDAIHVCRKAYSTD